jgi:hypothetical protein
VSFEHKPNCGSLFPAQKNSERQPDRQGDAKIVCPSCGNSWISRIAGWLKEGKSGTWLSLRFSVAISKAPSEPPDQPDPPPGSDYGFDDDLPF